MKRRTLITVVTATALVGGATAASATIVAERGKGNGGHPAIELSVLGRHYSDLFDQGAAEIVAHDPATQRLFVVSAAAAKVEVLDIADPTTPTLVTELATADAVGDPDAVANSVAIRRDGLIAVAVEAGDKVSPGWVVFYDRAGTVLNTLHVGALPDMVTFTPDGRTLLVANEAEPNEDVTFDPEGSVSIVNVRDSASGLTQSDVRTADFGAWDRGEKALDPKVRVFGKDVTGNAEGTLTAPGRIARSLEPEYIAVDDKSRVAYVTLQEANALGVLDIASATFTKVVPFGYKDYLLAGNELDVNDQDGVFTPRNWPVYGMYQPDAVALYQAQGRDYLVTANEGDTRDWPGYSEVSRLRALTGTTPICADSSRLQAFLASSGLTASQLRDNANLGRLNVTTATGLRTDGTCYEDLYAFGTRSLAIWSTDGTLVWDSGSELERLSAEEQPANFNANNTENSVETRSDDKGIEPEGVTVGTIKGRAYAFIAFERTGGIAVYDVTDPKAPSFVDYLNPRDFGADISSRAAGDLGPEGLHFIEAKDSPIGVPLLAVANEVSGTTTLFRIDSVR